jgi:bifunctional non-homologous end joining protein LigD
MADDAGVAGQEVQGEDPDLSAATSMPEWFEPMAATLTQDRFTGPDWLFERKFDGIRLFAYKQGDDVRLYSRNRLPQHLPAVASAIRALPVEDLHS